MNPRTERRLIQGPAGDLECAIDEPAADALNSANASAGIALVCHPHPLYGGTLDNKVAQTMARAFTHCGLRSVRFNFRGVGRSAGAWDEGRGEIDDAMSVLDQFRAPGQALLLGGFSFGAYVASHVAARIASDAPARRLILLGPAVVTFPMAPVAPSTLVVHGEMDDVVPLSGVLDWARPQSLPVTVIPGAGHFFHGQLPLLKGLVQSACATA